MLEAREIYLIGLSMLHAVIDDSNAEALLSEARGKSKKAIKVICCRIQPKPMLQAYIRRIATSDDSAPVRGDTKFTHVARCLLTDYTQGRIDKASHLFIGIDMNEIVARAVDMFVDCSLMMKRRVLKQTKATASIQRHRQSGTVRRTRRRPSRTFQPMRWFPLGRSRKPVTSRLKFAGPPTSAITDGVSLSSRAA